MTTSIHSMPSGERRPNPDDEAVDSGRRRITLTRRNTVIAWLMALLPLVPPIMPLVRWPVAARVVPQLQELGKALYTGAWLIGVQAGLSWGLTIGIAFGQIWMLALIVLWRWGFVNPVKTRR